MIRSDGVGLLGRRGAWRVQFRVWQLALLVFYVAVAIVNIQDQRRGEAPLIALAVVGFAGYWCLGWVVWRVLRRLEPRLGRVGVLGVYLLALAGLFLIATVVYLTAEYAYLVGHF